MDYLQVLKHLLQGELHSKSAFLLPARKSGQLAQIEAALCKHLEAMVPLGNQF